MVPPQTYPLPPFVFLSFFLFFFLSHAHGMWKFPGQGLNPHHGSNQSYSKNARSLTFWATENSSFGISYLAAPLFTA